jgi:nucleoside-diphosphate-sugar epimerase
MVALLPLDSILHSSIPSILHSSNPSTLHPFIPSTMPTFLTGATGLIGQRLTQDLAESGHQVKALVRSPQKAERLGLNHPNITLIQGDLDDKELLKREMAGCQQVYHLAALAGVWAKPGVFQQVNVVGTRNVMEAAREAGVEKVVKTSTAGVIGPAVNGPVHEATEREVPFFNEYEQTKAEAEDIALAYAQQGMQSVVVMPTRVFGPGPLTVSNSVTKLIAQYAEGKWYFRPGDGKSSGNYVYLPDVVEGHRLAMEKGKSGERYLLGGEDVSYNELFELLAELTDQRRSLLPMPLGLMLAMARIQLFLADNFGREPLITPDWVRKYNYHWEVSSSKAQQELGYQITPLREAVQETLEWLERKG